MSTKYTPEAVMYVIWRELGFPVSLTIEEGGWVARLGAKPLVSDGLSKSVSFSASGPNPGMALEAVLDKAQAGRLTIDEHHALQVIIEKVKAGPPQPDPTPVQRRLKVVPKESALFMTKLSPEARGSLLCTALVNTHAVGLVRLVSEGYTIHEALTIMVSALLSACVNIQAQHGVSMEAIAKSLEDTAKGLRNGDAERLGAQTNEEILAAQVPDAKAKA